MNLTPKEVRDQLIAAIDEAMEKGQWETSLFLRNILKQLQELRLYVTRELKDESEQRSSSGNLLQKQQALEQLREGYQQVYIALYQSQSNSLDRWFSAIKMLAGYSVSRPAYHSQQDVENMLREKQSINDAYVVVWIKQADLLPPYSGIPLKDRWGHELLTLREGSFRLENVIEFVHDKKHYYLVDQNLVLADQ